MALNYRNHHTPIALVLEAKLCYGHAANHLSHFLAVSAIMADERHFSVVSECALAVFIGGYFRGILLGHSPVHLPRVSVSALAWQGTQVDSHFAHTFVL
jgi:hypothetical protein